MLKDPKSMLGSCKLAAEKRAKLLEADRLRKRMGMLQAELRNIVTTINKIEDDIEEARKNNEKAWLDVIRVRAEQQKTLQGLVSTIKALETKIPVLRKEKDEAEENRDKELQELMECEHLLRSKQNKLEELKMILPIKQQDLEELLFEQKDIEDLYHEKVDKILMEEAEKRSRNFRNYQEVCMARMESYAAKAKEIEEQLTDLNEERLVLQDVITLYSEKLPLLEEKQLLIATEFQCLANADLDDSDENFY